MKEIYRTFTAEALALEYQATQDEEILQELIRRNSGLIHIWIMNYRNIPHTEVEDLEEEAYMALWKAAKSYDPSKGVAFNTCLKGYVTQSFNRLYKEITRKKRYNGADPASYEELEDINREKASYDDYSGLEVQDFIKLLGGTTKKVALLLMDGVSKGDIALSLNISGSSVTYHCKQLQKIYLAYMEG